MFFIQPPCVVITRAIIEKSGCLSCLWLCTNISITVEPFYLYLEVMCLLKLMIIRTIKGPIERISNKIKSTCWPLPFLCFQSRKFIQLVLSAFSFPTHLRCCMQLYNMSCNFLLALILLSSFTVFWTLRLLQRVEFLLLPSKAMAKRENRKVNLCKFVQNCIWYVVQLSDIFTQSQIFFCHSNDLCNPHHYLPLSLLFTLSFYPSIFSHSLNPRCTLDSGHTPNPGQIFISGYIQLFQSVIYLVSLRILIVSSILVVLVICWWKYIIKILLEFPVTTLVEGPLAWWGIKWICL